MDKPIQIRRDINYSIKCEDHGDIALQSNEVELLSNYDEVKCPICFKTAKPSECSFVEDSN